MGSVHIIDLHICSTCFWYIFQGSEFETVIQLMVEALCQLGEADAVQGLYNWCKEVIGRKISWIKAAIEKAYGR